MVVSWHYIIISYFIFFWICVLTSVICGSDGTVLALDPILFPHEGHTLKEEEIELKQEVDQRLDYKRL